MSIVLIDNGKKPNELLNAKTLFWLPPDTQFGNFQLKLMKICNRLDEANRRIIDSYSIWEEAKKSEPFVYQTYDLANEQAIYLIRKSCDEIISLIWCLNYWKLNDHIYPNEIKCDCIGKVLKQKNEQLLKPFKDHLKILSLINEISNAYKHSFVNSEINFFSYEEPFVYALSLKYNKVISDPVFYSVALRSIVNDFNMFYKSCIEWLKNYRN